MAPLQPQFRGTASLTQFPSKPRVFILTDITNEPDDAESFCRYLTYSNQFRTEGVVAVTSTWLKNKVAPQNLHGIVDAYEKVVDNINAHTHPGFPYPSAQSVRDLIKSGPPVYGMEAVGDDIPFSEGGELLLERLTAPEEDPLWVLVWGGVNVLAQVLHKTRDRPDAAKLREKLRVYTISDQDDCGGWIRQQWPDIFYICSVHGWNQYQCAAWTGISAPCSGDVGGPDGSKVTHEWVKENVQFIIEGDTPTFLYLVQNGLGVPEEPLYGSWGGRYIPANVSPKGLSSRGHFADAIDTVIGVDGKPHRSSQATIWRWRNAFQDDFAARMQWTLTSDFSKANHHPVVSVNGDSGLAPIRVEADAGASYDPDGDNLSFKWYQYREPSSLQTYHGLEVSDVEIKPSNDDGSKVEVKIAPAEKSCIVFREKIPLERGLPLHVILEVKDNGTPSLTSYRRVIIQPVDRYFGLRR
ncbi:cellulose-binding protein [Colletotrichum higginsianum]|nr:cellulose-binding protein [Colletotrichum higginsianum]